MYAKFVCENMDCMFISVSLNEANDHIEETGHEVNIKIID